MVRPFAMLDEWGEIWGPPGNEGKKINMINVFRPSRCPFTREGSPGRELSRIGSRKSFARVGVEDAVRDLPVLGPPSSPSN